MFSQIKSESYIYIRASSQRAGRGSVPTQLKTAIFTPSYLNSERLFSNRVIYLALVNILSISASCTTPEKVGLLITKKGVPETANFSAS